MMDWKMGLVWWNRQWNVLQNLQQYQSLLCSYLLTNLLIASSALHWPAFMQPP